MDPMVPGEELRRLREARGWSLEDAARRIGYAGHEGSGVKQLYLWETGKTRRPRSKEYHEYVRLLTGVEQVGLTEIDARLRHVEAMLEKIIKRVDEQTETLKQAEAVPRVDEGELRRFIEAAVTQALGGPFGPERFLKSRKQRREVAGVPVEPVELDVVSAEAAAS